MNPVTKQQLIDDYECVAQELDKKPTLTEYNEHGEYSSTPIYNVFEGFEELKDAAGFETGEQKISDETLLDDLRRVADEIGRSPPLLVYEEKGEYNFKTLKRRWGSWHDVQEKAGLEPTDHSEHWKGQGYNPNRDRETVTVDCAYCGDDTEKRPKQLERFNNPYCSKDCQYAVLSEQTGEDARGWDGGKVELACEWCGDTRMIKPSKADSSRFCRQECMFEWRSQEFSGEDHPRFKENTERTYYGPNFPAQRLKALDRDNHSCQVCGKHNQQNVYESNCGLNCHHIRKFKEYDGYKEANRLENLIMLCSVCHQYVENDVISVPNAVWHRQNAVLLTK